MVEHAMASVPDITIVLIVGTRRERGANALASLLAQEGIERAEIILLDLALDRFPRLAGSDHTRVRTIRMSYDRHYGELRAYGMHVARGAIVGYLEEHAVALPGWLKGILDAFDRGAGDAVAGVMVPADPGPRVGTLVCVLSFGRWLDATAAGPTDLLPGLNTAYRRSALLEIGDDLDQRMLAEPMLQWRLHELGYTLYLDASARWIHLNEDRLQTIAYDYFFWNVLFGRLRVQGRSAFYRALRIVTVPLVLPVRIVKSLLRLHRLTNWDWFAYIRLFPYLLLIHLADTFGLLFGYLGMGNDLGQKLTFYELSQAREPAPAQPAGYPHVGDRR